MHIVKNLPDGDMQIRVTKWNTNFKFKNKI